MQPANAQVSLEPRQIRLVRFASSVDDGDSSPLQFEMRGASLDDHNMKYAALSYVWGDQTEKIPILINGKPLHVGRNLHEALLHLHRLEHAPVSWLWIDAICIDQLDLAERALHVAMMDEIYSGAELVYVWLGPACETSDEAMEFISRYAPVAAACGVLDIREISVENEAALKDYVSLKLSSPRKDRQRDAVTTGEESQQEKQAQLIIELLQNSDLHNTKVDGVHKHNNLLPGIENLMQRDYWSRIWTFQELTLAKQSIVLCGTKAVDLEGFASVIGGIAYCMHSGACRLHPDVEDFARFLPGNFAESVGLDLRRAYRAGSLRLDRIVYRTVIAPGRPHYAASDPKDILFGLFGILSAEDRAGFKVDYTMSMGEVFSILTKMLLRRHEQDEERYTIDCCVPREDDGSEAELLPSWVPDWREVGRYGIGVYTINHLLNFDASHGFVGTSVGFHTRRTDDRTSQDPLVLRVHGCIVDRITEVMTPAKWHSSSPWYSSHIVDLEAWMTSIRDFTGLGADSGPGEDYIWRTVLQGYAMYGRPRENDRMQSNSPADEEIVRWVRMIFRKEHIDANRLTEKQREYIRHGPYRLDDRRKDLSTLQDQVNYLQGQIPRSASSATRERTLFKTRKSMLGMGHVVVREGDVVALLEGVRSPVILRHRPDGGYTFRGDAYVDGIMEGQFMQTHPVAQVFDLH